MNLTIKALKRPVTALMIFTCFIVIGLIASQMLPLEYFPDISDPSIRVEIPYLNSTPEEVEREIARPVEEVLATVSGFKRMNSFSGENGCNVRLYFDLDVNSDIKAVEMKEKVDSIRHLLPDDVERIYVRHGSAADSPILTLRLSSQRDLSQYYNMLNRVLKRPLERLPGVSRVELQGVEKKEILIQLNADRLIAHRVDLDRLSRELRNSNFLVTAGRITDGKRRYRVRPIGELSSVEELNNLVIGENNLRLRDIAKVTYDRPKMIYGRHLDRKYAVALDIYKEAGANTVDMADGVKAKLVEIGKDPRMQGISIYFMDDKAEGITSSLDELLKSGVIGAGLAILLLLFFLRRFSTTFMVALAVPFCLLVTMAFMFFFKMSLNILSMMGLLLAVGMLVDNAVVVTESIHRHQLQDRKRKESSITGTKEVAMAITAGTLTTICVFMPFLIVSSDMIAIYLKHVSFAFVIAMVVSLAMSLTIVPLLASRIKLPKPKTKATIIDKMENVYGRVLDWMIRRRAVSVLLILLILFSVAVPAMFVKLDMFPQQNDRSLFMRMRANSNYTLDKIIESVDKVEEYLYANQSKFEIKSVYTYFEGTVIQCTIILTKGKDARKPQEQIRREIEENLPKFSIGQFSFDRRRSFGGGERLTIFLEGKSSARLIDLSEDVARLLSRVEGFADVRSQAQTGEQEIRVVVDRERARKNGFSVRQVANMVSIAMRGQNLRRFHDEYGEIDVRVQFQEGDKQTMEHLKNIVLFDKDKNPIKLSTLADFRVRKGPGYIYRENRVTSMGVYINLKDITVDDAKRKIKSIMNGYRLPAGYDWSFGRSFDHGEEAFKNMMINMMLALCLIYFIMASLFESIVLPAAIWTSIIFAVVGVFWFFLITGTTFSLMALIGILILIGVVVNNGIVLIDHIDRFREKGKTRREAIVLAGRERIRPILMTAGTTILSLIPLCIGTTQIGGDGPPYFPMARAIAGGLAFSTLVTLLVLPRIYMLLDDLRNYVRNLWKKSKTIADEPLFKKAD